jgi:hypothetical protein
MSKSIVDAIKCVYCVVQGMRRSTASRKQGKLSAWEMSLARER